jgi:hypothetical protein
MPSHGDSANSGVPLAAMLTLLTSFYAWMLQVIVALGHYFSGGKWPGPIKESVVMVLLLCSTLLAVTLSRKYRGYYAFAGRASLTTSQTIVMVCFLMLWVAFGVWLAAGPPGPEFKPA